MNAPEPVLSRRRLLGLAGGAAAAMALGGCGSLGGGGSKDGKLHLNMFIWAGSNQGVLPREVVKQFLAENPEVSIDFVESNNTVTYPKMVAAKKTTPDDNYVDFGFFNASTFAQGVEDEMWDALNPSAVPNMSHVLKPYQVKDNMGAGYQLTVAGLLHNKKVAPASPTSWKALWDPAFAGKVAVFDYQWIPLVLAARLNGGSETQIDAGFKVWAEHASQFKALLNSNDQLLNLMSSGDAALSYWWYGISKDWIKGGAPFEYVTPAEGAVSFPAYLAMVSNLNSEQKDVAQQIINRLLDAKNAGRYADLTGTIAATDNAVLTERQKKDPALQPEVGQKAMQFDWGAIASQDAEWRKRWDSEVKSRMK
ncbi:extracellular solute-binding protein [Actinomadura soli]|uniref:Extracellular solute-binding protein n=1 Tax=Actinomadura soli TaxID=2508997 RepID=A0A5C4JHP1_9ACTN|nr:extracellular solute-binding protein [Actinomadura soli]TMR05012.1 extracellular solute-binding protein [Actinomadura soli]